MSYHFKNLVFEGGGVKGIAYLGAMEVLDDKQILSSIERVGGTSAGAINAVLTGLGFSLQEMQEIVWNLDFNKFLDDEWGIYRDGKRLLNEFGWYRGDYFRNWIASHIKSRTGNSEATFADIDKLKASNNFRDIHLVGTNLSTGFKEIFSKEHTPRMCVADAARISMSIPLFFAAIRNVRKDVYVDGGVLANYPIKLFDREKYVSANSTEPDYYKSHNTDLAARGIRVSPYVYNKETLGFRLDSAKEIAVFRDQAEPPRKDIQDFFDYIKSLMETFLEFQQNLHLHSDDWQRTVYIDTLGVKTTEFGLSDKKKTALVNSGRENTKKYLDWYDNNPATNK